MRTVIAAPRLQGTWTSLTLASASISPGLKRPTDPKPGELQLIFRDGRVATALNADIVVAGTDA